MSGLTFEETEALYAVMRAHGELDCQWHDEIDCRQDVYDTVARIIGARLREAKAAAWQIGYLRGVVDTECEMEAADNPYMTNPTPAQVCGAPVVAGHTCERAAGHDETLPHAYWPRWAFTIGRGEA